MREHHYPASEELTGGAGESYLLGGFVPVVRESARMYGIRLSDWYCHDGYLRLSRSDIRELAAFAENGDPTHPLLTDEPV